MLAAVMPIFAWSATWLGIEPPGQLERLPFFLAFQTLYENVRLAYITLKRNNKKKN
jgi:hypothetical protein